MNFDWQEFGSLLGVVTLLDTMILWAIKWLVERNNELLAERFKQRLDKDIEQDRQLRYLDDQQRGFNRSLTAKYMRRDEATVSFERLEEKVDTIWTYLLEEDRRKPDSQIKLSRRVSGIK